MELKEACQFLSDISGISTLIVNSSADLNSFCKSYYFHRTQDHFTVPYLRKITAELSPNTILFMQDHLLIDFVIIRTDENTLFIGPYITQDMTQANIQLLKSNYQLDDLPDRDYLAYRSRFPLREESQVLHDCRMLLKNTGHDLSDFHQEHNYNEKAAEITGWKYDRTNFENLINERYRIEQEMIEFISEGNDTAAVNCYRQLHNNVKYMVNYGGTPNESRISSGITRSTVRLAAYNAGLPPVIIDDISGESTQNIRRLNTREEMSKENERLIQTFAQAVSRYRKNTHSALVFNAISLFERHYNNQILIEETANRLGVSATTLINNFKKETGLTPNAYLNNLRIQKAKRLLRSTRYSIQQISEMVGIPDGNYFVKCFRKITDTTPSAYRKSYYSRKEKIIRKG